MSFAFPRESRSEHGRVAVLVDVVAEAEAMEGEPFAPLPSTVFIKRALMASGFEPCEIPLEEHRPGDWVAALLEGGFDLAFNLCETVGGHASGEHLTASTVELLGIPMTGAPSATLLYCLHKDRCAAMLAAHRVPVPRWRLIARDSRAPIRWRRFPAIVKPAAEDGSNGVHPTSVVRSPEELAAAVERLQPYWEDLIVQEFIDGREINVAIVGDYVMPPAEIDFTDLPDGEPPIVSYAAKWVLDSDAYRGTRPVCPAPLSPILRRKVIRLATRAWALMDGAGYARIDLRVRADGSALVIDVNPNPDLSPDAGLARQARVAGWSYEDLIACIAEDALRRGARTPADADRDRRWKLVRPAVPEERPA